ncbi:methyltransferase domain-containing protein [Apiospora phragmitis]|uniref:Methyltransferase domain-containing protein n=1 Tax=Apiospora phragmitis TaxID=2905665 RepID=A0ABR1VXN9_9PEZI
MADNKEGYDPEEIKAKIYHAELPYDIGPIQQLLEEYSGIPAEEVSAHIHAIRDRMWAVKPYVCIGSFRFLSLAFVDNPHYQTSLARLRAPGSTATFLDMACCVGQVLRHLAWSGVDPSRLYGADLERPFIEAGYDLFRDRNASLGKQATFVVGDALAGGNGGDPVLEVLDGKISIVHASAFFHLFTWQDQVVAAKRIVRFFREQPSGEDEDEGGAMIFGRQAASTSPRELTGVRGERRFLHDAATWRRMWDEVGEATGTRWRTEVEMEDVVGQGPDE